MTVTLRPLTPDDASRLRAIFLAAVAGTGAHYSAAQRQAWAAALVDLAPWEERLAEQQGVIALRDGRALGFMTLGEGGYLDMAYVHPDAAGQGIGRMLHDAVSALAGALGETRMTTHASLAAQPFFEALGWQVTYRETVNRGDQNLDRFAMTRTL